MADGQVRDLTVIFLTCNEMPESWTAYHRDVLLEAVGNYSLITMSRRPVAGMGLNILDDAPRAYLNVYRQLLRGVMAAETEYIAVAEDDTLYPPDHFSCFRPTDSVAYNWHRWSLFTWLPSVFSCRNRISNCGLVAPRELMIAALEEKFEKYPTEKSYKGLYKFIGEVGRNNYERVLGLTQWPCLQFYSPNAIIKVDHPTGTEYRMHGKKKRLGGIRAVEIPYWGTPEKIMQKYRGE